MLQTWESDSHKHNAYEGCYPILLDLVMVNPTTTWGWIKNNLFHLCTMTFSSPRFTRPPTGTSENWGRWVLFTSFEAPNINLVTDAFIPSSHPHRHVTDRTSENIPRPSGPTGLGRGIDEVNKQYWKCSIWRYVFRIEGGKFPCEKQSNWHFTWVFLVVDKSGSTSCFNHQP